MELQELSTGTPVSYDFDRLIERRGTDSVKWGRYGADVLPLWVADMDFPSCAPVLSALRERVEHGVFGYGVEPPELRGVVQERLEQKYGWKVRPDSMMFLPGVVVGLNLAVHACAGVGDELLLQTPVYPPFLYVGKNTGRGTVNSPLVRGQKRYEIDFEAFEAAITPRTRVFLLCNPHNPVGRAFTRPELERIAEICLRHDLIICSDEIHQDFVYEGHVHCPIASLSPEVAARTVTLISPSKSYNIAGFHFAIAVAENPEVKARLEAACAGLLASRPGLLDFVAGLAAYQHGGEWLRQVVSYLQANRDYLVSFVERELPGVNMVEPEGSYLGWLDCREAGIDGSAMEFFLKEAKVALNPGPDFGKGGEGFVRLNFGCPRSILEEALSRMRSALVRG
ncbi:MAG TPA: PatB family C-S lyase [Chloroflexota bacterium]|nr:PatB family C-S lyase [Chloroflexota bacterium]